MVSQSKAQYFYNMAGRRFIAFIFLMLYSASLPGISEMYRFPLLVEHYFDHMEEGNSTAQPGQYLIQHYIQENGTDKDAAEDAQLPFKSALSFTNATSTALMPFEYAAQPPLPVPGVYRINNQDLLPDSYFDSIWQPPRLS